MSQWGAPTHRELWPWQSRTAPNVRPRAGVVARLPCSWAAGATQAGPARGPGRGRRAHCEAGQLANGTGAHPHPTRPCAHVRRWRLRGHRNTSASASRGAWCSATCSRRRPRASTRAPYLPARARLSAARTCAGRTRSCSRPCKRGARPAWTAGASRLLHAFFAGTCAAPR